MNISGKQTMDDIVKQVANKSISCRYVLQRVVDTSTANETPTYMYLKAHKHHIPYKGWQTAGASSDVIPLLTFLPEDEPEYETSDPEKARQFLNPQYAIELRDKLNAELTRLHPSMPLYSLGTMVLVPRLSKHYPTKNNLLVRLIRKDGDIDTAFSHLTLGRKDVKGNILTFSLVNETQSVISGALFGSLQGAEKFKDDVMTTISPECRKIMQQYEAWHVSCTMVPALNNIDTMCSKVMVYDRLRELGLVHYNYIDGEHAC